MAAPLAVFAPPDHGKKLAGAVLVVDDEPSIRRLLSHNLVQAGFDVQLAASGEDALELLDVHPFDLVLLDLMLPGIDGLEVLQAISKRKLSLPVILLTAHGSIENAVEAMKLGAHDFLTKPFEMDRLAISMRNALELAQLSKEVRTLRSQLSNHDRFEGIIGADGGLQPTIRLLEKVIPTDLTVLLQGESGTGKEVFARAIHSESQRSTGPFVAINCAALPESLLESELFGHEKGSFTGATHMRTGKFEAADGGTILLDEIGELSPEVQAKLLRTLQERTVTRLGSSTHIPVDVRILCATNRDLSELCEQGTFREDLYYRVAVFPLTIPPLRERREDIPILALHVLSLANPGIEVSIDPRAMEVLEAYDWPGNVRELQNILRRASVLAGDGHIHTTHLPAKLQAAFGRTLVSLDPDGGSPSVLREGSDADPTPTLEDVERAHILRTINNCRGNLSLASRTLAIGRTTLYRKLEKYGITP